MTRRGFVCRLVALSACVGAFGLACFANAQQPGAPRRIGVLLVGFSPKSKEAQAFQHGLKDAGYTEGRDVVIEWRSANGDFNRIPELVTDLVQSKAELIVVDNTPAALAAKRATSTIPIVMAMVADPVGSGLVASLAHPRGNVTGLSVMSVELSIKRLQLLKEAIPRLTRVAVLWNPAQPWHPKVVEELKAVAPSLSIELHFVSARTPEEIGPAFSAVRAVHAQTLYVLGDHFFFMHRRTLLDLASKSRVAVMYGGRGTSPMKAH